MTSQNPIFSSLSEYECDSVCTSDIESLEARRFNIPQCSEPEAFTFSPEIQ
jgi:hypothetical protein